MYNVHYLNKISPQGTALFTEDYQSVDNMEQAEAVLVRSANMHEMHLPENLLAIARAGAGVNNIPLNGQVLMRNYSYEEAVVVVREMTDVLVLDLVAKGLVTDSVTLWVAYDHKLERPSSHGTVKFDYLTNSSRTIIDGVETLYRQIVDRYTGIRRIEICANRVKVESYLQYNLFMDMEAVEKEKNLQKAVLSVQKRYGKNAIMRGANLLDCSTYRERNGQIGGHRA